MSGLYFEAASSIRQDDETGIFRLTVTSPFSAGHQSFHPTLEKALARQQKVIADMRDEAEKEWQAQR